MFRSMQPVQSVPAGKNAGKNKKKRANKKRRAAAAARAGGGSGAMTAQLGGSNRATVPQWFKISPEQVFNHAGGAVWKLTDAEHAMRYLIMGAKDNGNFYQTSEQVSSECSTSVLKMIRNPNPAEFQKLCKMLESISTQGRAARQEPTLLSLAAAIVFATTPAQKSMALALISKCVRIPTHLFMLSGYITDLSQCKPGGEKGKGWGTGVRRELAKYYVSRRGLELATAVTKYKNREGWCHRDLLRMLHINPAQLKDDGARLVFKYLFACDGGAEGKQFIRQLLSDILAAKTHEEAIQLLDKVIPSSAKEEKQSKPASAAKPSKPASAAKAKPSSSLISGIKSAIQGIIGGQNPQHKTQINFKPEEDVSHIEIATSAFQWKRMFMTRSPTGGFTISLELPVGTHDFKFIVRGVWQCDPRKPTRKTGEHENNFIVVSEQSVSEDRVEPIAVVRPPSELLDTAKYLQAVLEVESCTTSVADLYKALKLVRDHGLVREQIPTHLLNSSDLWKELLMSKGANGKQEGMPIEALIRNLGKMSTLPNFMGSENTAVICRRLSAEEDIQRSRIHPFKVLVGSLTYGAGKALKGSLAWTVSPLVRDTLTTTFLKAFKNVSPTGKRYMVALDVSGSMDVACMGCPSISCRMASAALALMLYETEPKVYLRGFTAQSNYGYGSTSSSTDNSFRNFDPNVRRGMTLQQFISATHAPFGPTDCSLPMRRAIEDGLTDIEAFIVMTDSETFAGPIHPQVALEKYRIFSKNPNVKLIVVGMTANSLTIADPNDRNTLNLAGFDTAMPEIIAMFVRGEL